MAKHGIWFGIKSYRVITSTQQERRRGGGSPRSDKSLMAGKHYHCRSCFAQFAVEAISSIALCCQSASCTLSNSIQRISSNQKGYLHNPHRRMASITLTSYHVVRYLGCNSKTSPLNSTPIIQTHPHHPPHKIISQDKENPPPRSSQIDIYVPLIQVKQAKRMRGEVHSPNRTEQNRKIQEALGSKK